MVILSLSYRKYIIPRSMLELIPEIIPVKEVGGKFIRDDSDISVEFTQKEFVEGAAAEEAQQQDYKTDLDKYQKWYNDEREKSKKLQAEIESLKAQQPLERP